MALAEIERLVDKLFSQKWASLHDKNALKDKSFKYPGVYLLAYPKQGSLKSGDRIRLKDVYYVGMSNSKSGLKGRLRQFKRAIEGKRGHSGGNTFFTLHGKPYSKLRKKKRILFAALPVECCSIKILSTANDFRKMGHVACLEYYAIAFVKAKTKQLPALNKFERTEPA